MDDLICRSQCTKSAPPLRRLLSLPKNQDVLPAEVDRVLIVGGAGAVGSLATQILKAKTKAYVVSTASRPESSDWCREMGADLVIDHTNDIEKQLASAGIQHVDVVLSTAKTSEHLGWITKVLRPFGHLSVLDFSPSLDANALMLKSLSLHLEMVFSKDSPWNRCSSSGQYS